MGNESTILVTLSHQVILLIEGDLYLWIFLFVIYFIEWSQVYIGQFYYFRAFFLILK